MTEQRIVLVDVDTWHVSIACAEVMARVRA